ncbi:phosphatidylglycerol/phosphatidylinositol transfer protein precursor [Glonium stellatum]|uniref:Phosphatidylglycerol/phosphatidylinositol transfer protein n=1 Tax=Glonium stellatum TaxID=574774 RepID=A0A8E2JTR5_9PEZI|nr:phosphatidylglycerol/phosphatidylinositol transfer protein precursor [Glonium stellatum]
MKLTSLLLPAVLTATVSARSPWLNGNQVSVQDATDVPGENPLLFCSDASTDILEIDSIDLDPNPPQAGHTLDIKATGILKKDVEEGAQIYLQVKYGLITLINQKRDLCDQVKSVDLECPLKKGPLELTKSVELPKQIPPGKYHVMADVLTKDGDKITCIYADVSFNVGG